MLEEQLPPLLGFQSSCVFLHNLEKDLLYSVCLDEESDNARKMYGPPGFEREFIIERGQVVEFPIDMGITGFVKKFDAICYINRLQDKQKDISKPPLANCFCLGKVPLTFFGQLMLGKGITASSPYFHKIDNFSEVNEIENAVYLSMQDEDIIKNERAIGVLQLFNKKQNDITQEDLHRLFYLRKLIGSQTERVKAIEECLRTTVALCQNQEILKNFKEGTHTIEKG